MITQPYQICKAALLTKVRTLTTYFPKPWQVSDDVTVLSKGADYFFIVLPSTFPTTRANGHEKNVTWNILADLYVRYSTHKESLPKFEAVRDALFMLLHSDPWLNKTPGVSSVLFSANGEILQDIAGNNPNFIIQTFTVSISQRVTFEF